MKLGKSKIVVNLSHKGKYQTTWIYVPSKVAKDNSFPFTNDEEVLLEIQDDSLIISRHNKKSNKIKKFGKENITLTKLIEKKAIENGDKVFLYYKDKEYSFHEINARANQISRGILDIITALNIKNPKISLMIKNSPTFIFSWFGIVKSGCVFVPINNSLRGEYLEYVLNNSDTQILIIDYIFIDKLKKIKHELSKIKRVYVHNAPEDFEFNNEYFNIQSLNSNERENPQVNIHDEDLTQIIYTEGMTGMPKGVMYRNMVKSAIYSGYRLRKIGLIEDTKIYCPTPLFRGVAQFYAIIPSLFFNMSVILAEEFDAKNFWKDIKKHEPKYFVYFGNYLLFLLYNNPSKFDRKHSLKWGYGFGAEIELRKTFENRFGVNLCEIWSQIEGVGTTINTLGNKRGKIGSVGKPLDIFELKIIDSEGNELPSGEENIGEIAVKSKINYKLEYYKQPENLDVVVDEDNWVYTGDFGYVDDDNYLYFMGKRSRIITRAGEKIYLKKIERITDSHPSIYLSICYTLELIPEKKKKRQELIIVAVKVKNSTLTHEKLNDFLYHNLPYYHVPRYIGFLEKLPKSPITEYLKREIMIEWQEKNAKRKVWDNHIKDYVDYDEVIK